MTGSSAAVLTLQQDADRPDTVDPTFSAPIVAALENTWSAIRSRHAEVPRVVLVLASGSDGAPSGWLSWATSPRCGGPPGRP
jgi:hypothetical protein